jgi:L-fucose mutarotase
VLKGVAPLIELDSYATPVIMTAPVPGDTLDPDVEARIRKALDYKGEIEFVSRDELYARAKRAFAVVQTGETAKYGNVFVKKGVTPVG